MKKVVQLLFFILLFSQNLNSFSQSFPERCQGKWTGTMYIWASGRLVDSVEIEFTVLPFGGEAGNWIWRTQYISEKMPMTKEYTLREKQNSPNIYLMDEGDGVILTNYVFGNKMYSLFKVEKTWLTASYELLGESLIFEVTSGVAAPDKAKGVSNYTVDFVQRVILKKQE